MPKDEEEDTTPALYQHCVNTYQAMLSEASSRQDDQDNEIIVWEGMFTALITSKLHLSVPYYTQITRALKRMGCIRQLKRGGGSAPSMWELITEPTEELFRNKMPQRKVQTDRIGMLQNQINDINRRLLILENSWQNFIEQETK